MILPIPRIFTARQVVSITGIPYSKLDFWTKSGLIQPSLSDATGSGSRRLYSRTDLIAIRVAWNLRKSGLSGPSLRKAMEYLQQQDLEAARVEKQGKDVILKSELSSISVLGNPGQLYLDFTGNISEAISHVNQELERVQNAAKIPSIKKSAKREISQRRARRA